MMVCGIGDVSDNGLIENVGIEDALLLTVRVYKLIGGACIC